MDPTKNNITTVQSNPDNDLKYRHGLNIGTQGAPMTEDNQTKEGELQYFTE